MDKSHRPIYKHPNAHTNNEIRHIRNYCRRNPNISLCELWYKLKRKKGYSRNITSLYRLLKRLNIKYNKSDQKVKKYVSKPYYTPKNIGKKWQIDVKYVPDYCKCDNFPKDIRIYFKHSRYVLHKRIKDLTPDQYNQLTNILDYNENLRWAYSIIQNLFEIIDEKIQIKKLIF